MANILNFRDMYPGAEQMILNLNYRSTPQILNACQNLIQHNQKKIDKELRTDNPAGDDVIVLESSSEETEALNLVSEINHLVERQDYAYTDIAVLYRCNFQSRVIEETLQQHQIPYEIQNGLCFYDRREVKILLDYLRLIANSMSDEGDEALCNVINTPNRYIGRKFMADLDDFQSESEMHLYEKLKSMPVDLPYIRKNVREFIKFIDPLIEDSTNQQPSELIHLLRVAIDYDRFITDDDMPSPDDVMIENLNQLQMAAARFNDIGSFLDYTETFQSESVSDNRDGVKLMTVHRSKGLEFPVVFLVGLVENILPSKKGNLGREVKAIFTPKYKPVDNFEVCERLDSMGYGPDTQVQCTLDPEFMSLSILDGKKSFDINGDKFKPGISISNSEVGLASLSIAAFILRLVCTNGLVLKTEISTSYRHVSTKILDEFPATMDKVSLELGTQRQKLGFSMESHVDDPLKTIESFNRQFNLNQLQKDAVEWAWPQEMGDTMFAVVNTYTRASQFKDLSAENSYQLQLVGGNILGMLN